MPVGSHALTYNIADQIWRRKPATVLDLGVGFGMQGVLVRQYVDQGVQPFRTQLIGVEAFPKYRNAVWDLYDVIFEREIIDFLAAYRQCLVEDRPFVYNGVSVDPVLFDMILMSDVIEHFDKPDGYQIAQDLMSLVAPKGTVLIGTPGVPGAGCCIWQ